jgi:hypothetical protein
MCGRVKPQLATAASLVSKSLMGSWNARYIWFVVLVVHHVRMLDSKEGCLDFASLESFGDGVANVI